MVNIKIWYSNSEIDLPIEKSIEISGFDSLSDDEKVVSILNYLSMDSSLADKSNITWTIG